MKNIKILVVEDNSYIQQIFREEFAKYRLNVIYASNGKEGKDIAEKEKPDIVLLDVILPDMNGIDVLKAIKVLSPESKVMIVSNLSDQETMKKATDLGAHDYFIKSNVEFFKIVEMIDRYIKEIQENQK